MTTINENVRNICLALINHERVTWPFGVDAAEGVMATLGLTNEVASRYTPPRGKVRNGMEYVPLGKDATRRLAAVEATVFAVAAGKRLPAGDAASRADQRAAGFDRGVYPHLIGANASRWTSVFRCVAHSTAGLAAALALAAEDGVRPFGGGEVVALPPSEETSEGRRWTF